MKPVFILRIALGFAITLPMLSGSPAWTQGSPAPRFTVTDIGTLGGAYSFAYAISQHGAVAGGAATPTQTNSVAQTGFFWRGGQPVSIGTLGGPGCLDCSSAASALMPNGNVIGLSETAVDNGPAGEDFCEFGTHHQCLAAVWSDGVLSALPTLPGGNNSEAFFVNARGEAVGVSEIDTLDNTCATPFQTHRFLAIKWSKDGVPTPLQPLPGDTVSFAFMINNRGQAVGMSGLCSNVILPPYVPGSPSAPHAVLWDEDGTSHDLSNPPGSAGVLNVASSINSQGQVIMNSLMNDGSLHAFLWSDSVFQDLGGLPGAASTFVPCCNNINDRGQITGVSVDASGNPSAIFWERPGETPVSLNSVLPSSSPRLILFPGGITNSGEIAASALNLNSFEVHAVLLSPLHP